MSDCKHCEHLTARWEDTAGEHKRWQCCHCGRIRSEYAPTHGLPFHGLAIYWDQSREDAPSTSRHFRGYSQRRAPGTA